MLAGADLTRERLEVRRDLLGQELVIGGYVPALKNFDSILVGYYENQKLLYAARVRNGFVPASREALFKRFSGLEVARCPLQNLPESKKGRWGKA